jgi:peptidyl-prolyl cis-trans isomerase
MKKIISGIMIFLCAAGIASAQTPGSVADSVAYYLGTTEGAFTGYGAATADNPNAITEAKKAMETVFAYPGNLAALKRAIEIRKMVDEFKASGIDVSSAALLEAFDKAVSGPVLSRARLNELRDSTNAVLRAAQTQSEKVYQERKAAEVKQNKVAGEEFLAAAKKKDKSIKTTPSGLSYKVVKSGKGEHPTDADRVKVHYTGRLIDGKVFDSSVERGEPATFGVTQVIPGWTEGLKLMTPGSKYTFYIPADLGYGDRGAGNDIKPGAMLVFDVELLGIEPK